MVRVGDIANRVGRPSLGVRLADEITGFLEGSFRPRRNVKGSRSSFGKRKRCCLTDAPRSARAMKTTLPVALPRNAPFWPIPTGDKNFNDFLYREGMNYYGQKEGGVLISDLIELCAPDGVVASSPPPAITIYRRDEPSALEAHLYEPVLCMVLQGAKMMRSGDQSVEIGTGEALVVSHHLPVVSRITQASERSPYLAIVLSLNLATLRELYAQLDGLQDQDKAGGAMMASWFSTAKNPFSPADVTHWGAASKPSCYRSPNFTVYLIGGSPLADQRKRAPWMLRPWFAFAGNRITHWGAAPKPSCYRRWFISLSRLA